MNGMHDWLSSKIKQVPTACIDCGAEGLASSVIASVYRCESCKQKAQRMQEQQDQTRRAREAVIERRITQRRLQSNGFFNEDTRLLRFCDLDRDRHNHDVLDRTQQWMRDRGRCLWLYGLPGVGKTHIARTILGECLRADRQVVAEVTVECFLRKARDWENGHEVIEALADVDVLLLDDLDTPILNQKCVAVLIELLSPRYARNLRTLITSNAAPVDVVRRAPDEAVFEKLTAAVDRLKPLTTISLEGDSRRGHPPTRVGVSSAFPEQRSSTQTDMPRGSVAYCNSSSLDEGFTHGKLVPKTSKRQGLRLLHRQMARWGRPRTYAVDRMP